MSIVSVGLSAAEQEGENKAVLQGLNHGNPARIEDYTGKGKWLVVMIWAHDCHVCNAEASHYDFFHDAHKRTDATVLGVTLDGQAHREEAMEFVARHDLSFPNLIGEPSDVMRMFSELTQVAWVGTPSFLIYDPEGKLVVQQIGAVPVELIEAFIKRNS
ncbi:MAG: TlpA family protein disulfide reductase [Gammaproteobacteria bacterium]|nr:TlpA family protein disulfide reductase [Gammaproteobacteria bacterium]